MLLKISTAIIILALSFSNNYIRVNNFKGLDVKTAPDKVLEGRCVSINNLDFDVLGSLKTRQGIAYLETYNDNIKNIYDSEFNAYIFDNSILYKNVAGTYNVDFCTNIRDDLYFFGIDTVKFDDSKNIFTEQIGYQPPAQSLRTRVLEVSGNLNGVFSYAMTYVYDGIYESNPVYSNGTYYDISFSNIQYALRFEDDTRFVMKKHQGAYLLYYLEADTVTENNIVYLDGDIYWSQLVSRDLYIVTKESSLYRFYKINTILCTSELINFEYFNNWPFRLWSNNSVILGTPYGYNDAVIVKNTSGTYQTPSFFADNNGFYACMSYIQGFNLYSINGKNLGTFYDTHTKVYRYTSEGKTESYYYIYPNLNTYAKAFYIEHPEHYVAYNNNTIKNNANSKAMTLGNYISTLVISEDYYLNSDKGLFNWDYNSGILISFNNNVLSLASENVLQKVEQDIWYEITANLTIPESVISSQNPFTLLADAFSIPFFNQKAVLDIPVIEENVRVNLYRSFNDTGFYFLDSVVLGNSEYIDNISPTQQSVIPMETDNDYPPNAIDSVYVVARQFYLDSQGTVWYSKINKPEAVPALNYIRIKTNSDDRPVKMIEHFGGLLIFFQKSVWFIDLSSYDTLFWIPRKLNTDFGCPYKFSVVKGKLPNQQIGIFYMAEDKSIRVLTGVGANDVQLFDNIYTDKLSLAIQPLLNNDNTNVNDVYLAYYDYKLYVSLLSGLYIWDSQHGGEWTKYILPFNQKYIGNIDYTLFFGEDNYLYQLSIGELNNLDNGDFRRGFEGWTNNGCVLSKDMVYYNNTSIEREFNADDSYLSIEYNADTSLYFYTSTEDYIELTGEGFYAVDLTGLSKILIGEKQGITEAISEEGGNLYLPRYEYRLCSVVSGNTQNISDIINMFPTNSIVDIAYYDEGAMRYYSVSGDHTIAQGESYYIQPNIDILISFNYIMPSEFVINFVTGDNYITSRLLKPYTTTELFNLNSNIISIIGLNCFDDFFSDDRNSMRDIDIVGKYRGIGIGSLGSFTLTFNYSSGYFGNIYLSTSLNNSYVDVLSNKQFATTFDVGLQMYGGTTSYIGDLLLFNNLSAPPSSYSEASKTFEFEREYGLVLCLEYAKTNGTLYVDINSSRYELTGNSRAISFIPSINTTISIKLYNPSSPPFATATINYISLKYDDYIVPIEWNYQTKIFGDSYEYFQDFDKIWLRGYQDTSSLVRVDYICNQDKGSYSDYFNTNLTGNMTINTSLQSLYGAGGRDIQLQFSGQDYIRLDAFTIKRSLREE